MLVLHGVWAGDGVALWAEDSGAVPGGPGPDPSAHPFAVTAAALRAAAAAVDAPGAAAAAERWLRLRLPATAGRPLPSPELGGGPAEGSAELREWRAPALVVRAPDAVRLLAALDGAVAAGPVPGPGLRHLAAVRRFAGRLASAGRLLPVPVDGGPPRWRPVLTGVDARHAAGLVAALRAVGRAHVAADADGRAGRLVFEALGALLDADVRARLGPLAGRLDRAVPAADRDSGRGRRLRDWYRQAHRPRERARLVVRLREPEPADEPGAAEAWRVEFWVRSGDDPSLQLPLRELWLGSGAAWLPDDVEETVLRELHRAARHYPAVRGALRDLAPDGIGMGTGGAYAFVRDVAPRLASAGFDVVLPHWAAGGSALGLKLTVRERPAAGGGSGIGAEELVDFSFEAVLGDTVLDVTELAELARLKQPLARLRGRWVRADPAHLRAALDFLRRRGRGRARREEAVRMAVAAEAAPGLPVAEVDADGELGALLSGAAERRLAPMRTPDGFDGTLRPYQERGAAWLRFLGGLGLGAILADDMGLGKTVQLLAVLADERAERTPGPTLLVCPVSLVGNWQREAAKFTPKLRVHVHHGPDRPHGNALARLLGETDLVVTTYGVVLRDAGELAAMPWHRVVCDEAQAVKNSDARQTRAVRALPAEARIALTGTPVENDLDELWSIMEFANPGLLGPAAAFRRGIADRVERDADSPDGRAGAALLRRLTGPFILRRVKTDRSIISDLPEKQEMRTWCTLTPEQAQLYKATVDDMTERLGDAEGMRRKGLVLATMARLKQICNHPAQFLGDGSALAGRSGKLDRLEGLLAEALAQGDRALCFTQYTAFGDRLAPYLAARLGREVLWLHGGTPRPRREEMMRRFQEADEPMVFLLSLKAAGTGLNLTAANHVVHIDRWWNPAVEDQATDRAFRIGQRRDVQVRKLICVGTLEERVDEMIERKRALAGSVVGTGEEWLTELSTADLREVLRLAPEAVAG
ncbi:SNF2-related protein [Marinactinospora rubrisoli]|uniref:SNF2-related protein n=1 Tax=Marinactinospora rubrisoli TaxID=2715399 RepID=A0ABW2KNZ1_9ACTN